MLIPSAEPTGIAMKNTDIARPRTATGNRSAINPGLTVA